jgi:hypothetical protein
MRRWLKQVLVAVDQLCNALAGGWADETISARCWRLRQRRGWERLRRMVDAVALLFRDKIHCEESYRSEQLRLQCPPELRSPDNHLS